MALLLAADLGTTSIKALVMSCDGHVLMTAATEYELQTPAPGRVEFGIADYWSAFVSAVRQCTQPEHVPAHDVRALSLSVQGETLVLSDEDGEPVMNAISWLDNRASHEADMLREAFGDDECFARTGQVSFVPTWPAAKLLWLRRNAPDVMARAAHVTLLEDYFLYRLTGGFACEPSLICSTAYWDLLGHGWWQEMLDYIGVSSSQLPEVRQSGELLGHLTERSAADLGLSRDVAVAVGGLDQACAAIGVGNIAPGIVSENTGAALAICATVAAPTFDPQKRMPLHAHAMPDRYMLHTFTSGGIVLRWFRDRFCTEESFVADRLGRDAYEILCDEAARVPPGCDGLVMLPHLQGAMAPENDPDARAVFVGLELHHHKGHLIRSIMEAMACAIRRNLDVIADLGVEVSEVRSTGGAAASALWNQIKADVIAHPTRTMEHREAACTGAAILAGCAVEVFESAGDAVASLASPVATYTPDPAKATVYQSVYTRYTALYDALAPVFPLLKSSELSKVAV